MIGKAQIWCCVVVVQYDDRRQLEEWKQSFLIRHIVSFFTFRMHYSEACVAGWSIRMRREDRHGQRQETEQLSFGKGW